MMGGNDVETFWKSVGSWWPQWEESLPQCPELLDCSKGLVNISISCPF